MSSCHNQGMDSKQAPVRPHRSVGVALLAFLLLFGSAIGIVIYQTRQNGQKQELDKTGFDLAQVAEQKKSAPTAAPAKAEQSGLNMVAGSLPNMKSNGASSTTLEAKVKRSLESAGVQGPAAP